MHYTDTVGIDHMSADTNADTMSAYLTGTGKSPQIKPLLKKSLTRFSTNTLGTMFYPQGASSQTYQYYIHWLCVLCYVNSYIHVSFEMQFNDNSSMFTVVKSHEK